jgi:phosphoribosylaminoimidazole carboxylase PurE protein
MPLVAIVLGSKSDAAIMEECARTLDRLGIQHETQLISAHRSPEKAREFALQAPQRGVQVIIAAAGMAAALPGVLASYAATTPVIGVPLAAGAMGGLDALLSIAQMPPGVPVATVAVGKWGATNAGILAAQILAGTDGALAKRLADYRAKLAGQVDDRQRRVDEKLAAARGAQP